MTNLTIIQEHQIIYLKKGMFLRLSACDLVPEKML